METNKLSDINPELAKKILEKYLIKDKIFARSQIVCRSGEKIEKKEKLDLNYIIEYDVEEMYITQSNLGQFDGPKSRDKSKYILASKTHKNIIFNEKFEARLNKNFIYTSIKISRHKIKEYLSNLEDYHQAILYKAMYPDFKLKIHNKKLSCFEKTLKELSLQTKKNHIKKALVALYDLIISIELDFIQPL